MLDRQPSRRRQLRGQIGAAARYGRDVGPLQTSLAAEKVAERLDDICREVSLLSVIDPALAADDLHRLSAAVEAIAKAVRGLSGRTSGAGAQ